MAEYSLTKLSPILYKKTTSEITIVSQNESLVQLHRIKKLNIVKTVKQSSSQNTTLSQPNYLIFTPSAYPNYPKRYETMPGGGTCQVSRHHPASLSNKKANTKAQETPILGTIA